MTVVRTGNVGPSRVVQAAQWASAALVVVAAHAGAVAWMLREPPMMAAEAAPPAAIMIELAPEAEAVDTSETVVAPDATESQEVVSETIEPVTEPPPPEPPPPEVVPEPPEEPPQEVTEPPPPQEPPVEDVAEVPPPEPEPETVEEVTEVAPEVEEADPLEREMLARLDGIAIPAPSARPRPPAPRPPPKAERPKQETVEKPRREARQKPAPAARATQKAKAEATASTRTAARQTFAGASAPSLSPARWQSRLMSHLERRKRYPRGALSRGESAVAHVRFRIDDAGNVLSASLARSSGVPELDVEVVALVRRASPMPPPPPGADRTITAPVRFSSR